MRYSDRQRDIENYDQGIRHCFHTDCLRLPSKAHRKDVSEALNQTQETKYQSPTESERANVPPKECPPINLGSNAPFETLVRHPFSLRHGFQSMTALQLFHYKTIHPAWPEKWKKWYIMISRLDPQLSGSHSRYLKQHLSEAPSRREHC